MLLVVCLFPHRLKITLDFQALMGAKTSTSYTRFWDWKNENTRKKMFANKKHSCSIGFSHIMGVIQQLIFLDPLPSNSLTLPVVNKTHAHQTLLLPNVITRTKPAWMHVLIRANLGTHYMKKLKGSKSTGRQNTEVNFPYNTEETLIQTALIQKLTVWM